jgi:RNA polymerase sigma factor (sigma-70 family)
MLHATGHDAEDVVQDALIRAYRGLRATDRPMALRPWLYMIVRNRALDELRTPQRAAFDDEFALDAVPSADAASCVEQRDEMRQLVEEIARLPERQRMALVLREFDGCSHVETAQRLRTTVPATKSLIIRARSNLHAAVDAAA